MPTSCCKKPKKDCGKGLASRNHAYVVDKIYTEGCFKMIEQKIDGHCSEGIGIAVGVCTFLLLRIILSSFMAYEMYKKNQEKNREKIWQMKMTVR